MFQFQTGSIKSVLKAKQISRALTAFQFQTGSIKRLSRFSYAGIF